MSLFPRELRQLGPNKLGIIWSDEHQSIYSVRNLRLQCHCANCVDEWSRKSLIKEEQIPQDVRPTHIESVGRYAIRIDWSDGHNTGIYPFDHLRKSCECPACKTAISET